MEKEEIQLTVQEEEIVSFGKENYWRGFGAATLLFIPILIFFMVVINVLINN